MPVTRGSENQIVTLSFRKKLVFGLLLLIGFGIYLGLAFLLSIRHLLRPSWLSNRASSFQDRRSDVLELHRDYVLDNAPDHLFVFMQIADTHISAYRDTTRYLDLRIMLRENLVTVAPEVILVTGDLTDARTENYIGSGQILEEWQGWLHLIEELHLQERTVWLDIRGNHDTFNMPKAAENLYHKRHTLLGRQGVNRSTIQIIVKGPDSYAFIGIDATIVPGLKRIYNYIGRLSDNDWNELSSFEKLSRDYKYVFWFGHFPFSSITYSEKFSKDREYGGGIYHLTQRGMAYLCGHFHNAFGFLSEIYARSPSGNLELELGDWKDNRMYRVLAVDHGFLSFSDVRNADYPIVLVTYPKDARFHLPYHEPSSLLLEGTHIRILALSPVGVRSVAVCLEGEMTCVPATRERVKPRYPEHVWPLASESLFTRRWNPEQYGTGLHQLEVIVVDNQGETKTVRHIFSLDGTSRRLGLFSHWFLLCDLRHVFMVNCFMVMFGLIIIPLCVLRYLALCFEGGYHQFPELNPGSPVSLVFHNQIKLVSVDRIFWLFLIYPLIISVCPWIIGFSVIDGIFGVTFLVGSWVEGTYISGDLTYFYTYLQLIFMWIPTYVSVSWIVDDRYSRLHQPRSASWRELCLLNVVPFLCCLGLTYSVVHHWILYGFWAAIFSPMRLWSLVWAVLLWYIALHLKAADFEKYDSMLEASRSRSVLQESAYKSAPPVAMPRGLKRD